MRLFLSIMLVMFSASAFSLPDQFNVYSSQVSGTKDTVCRSILNLYTQKYNANPIFVFKKGAGGTIAMMDMLNDQKFSVLCSGPSESIYNITAFPGKEKEHKMLGTVMILAIGPSSFYTKPDGKYKNIEEIINSKEKITVGFNAQGPKTVAKAMLGNKEIIWVPFTNSVDSVPSLLDGSLDMYADSGSLEELARGGKIRSLGYLGGNGSLSGVDLSKKYPVAAQLPAFVALTVSINANPADIEELNVRLRTLISSTEYISNIGKIGWAPAGLSVEKSNEFVSQFRQLVDKLDNGK